MPRLPMPGETWKPREGETAHVRIDERTTVGEVIYEYLPARRKAPLFMQSTQAFIEDYEFSEEARDE